MAIWARFLFLARSKLRLCSANHRPGYCSNLPCDWPSTARAYSCKLGNSLMQLGTQTFPFSRLLIQEFPSITLKDGGWSVPTPEMRWGNFVYAASQWETTLQCNVVSHWLGTYCTSVWNSVKKFIGPHHGLEYQIINIKLKNQQKFLVLLQNCLPQTGGRSLPLLILLNHNSIWPRKSPFLLYI